MSLPRRLWVDLETWSEVPIAHGTHVYAAAAQVLLFAWAVDDAPAVAARVQVGVCEAAGFISRLGSRAC